MPNLSKARSRNTSGPTNALMLVSKAEGSKDANGKSKTSLILDHHFKRSLEDRIRERAYELYVGRGCQDGAAERDWLEAELEILAGR